MLYIDDSGWGSLISGVMIGGYNSDGGRFAYKLIPVSYFKGKKFKTGKYRAKAVELFLKMWPKLGTSEKITICRGTVLDGIYDFLSQHGFGDNRLIREEIKDPLQSYLENKFAEHLVECGVPRNSKGAHCLSFDDQVKWANENEDRIKFIKTGWPSWETKYAKNKK